MPNISSFEVLDCEIQKIHGKPKVLEALWVNDPEGWVLHMKLYSEVDFFFWKQKNVNDLGTIIFSFHLTSFNGLEYEYPEALLAQQLGEEAARKYGLTFYFPSGEIPNIAC